MLPLRTLLFFFSLGLWACQSSPEGNLESWKAVGELAI